MDLRAICFLAGLITSAHGDFNADQQNSFNYQPNEAQVQQAFAPNVYGTKIPPGELKPTVNQGELQRSRPPMVANGIPFAAPYYGHYPPMQALMSSPYPEPTSEAQSPAGAQAQKPTTGPETYNVVAPPSPYMYPSAAPRPVGTPAQTGYMQTSKGPQPQQQSTNTAGKQSENGNSISSPVTYSYPVPIPMPFPSYFTYPQIQYPR